MKKGGDETLHVAGGGVNYLLAYDALVVLCL